MLTNNDISDLTMFEVSQERFHLIGVIIINVSDTIINAFMIIAIIIGFFQVRNLKFVQVNSIKMTIALIPYLLKFNTFFLLSFRQKIIQIDPKWGGGHFTTFTGPMLFFAYRPHLLIYFDEMLYDSLY